MSRVRVMSTDGFVLGTIETKGMSRQELRGLSDRVHEIISKPVEEAMVMRARVDLAEAESHGMATRF